MHRTRPGEALGAAFVILGFVAVFAPMLARRAAAQQDPYEHAKVYNAAINQYAVDHDGWVPPSQYNNAYMTGQGDANVGMVVYPYLRSTEYMMDLASPIGRHERITKDLVDPQTLPPKQRLLQTLFNMGIKNDHGYNTDYFSPMGYDCGNNHVTFRPYPINMSQVTHPESTILTANSDWDRDASGGAVGGGSWIFDMPCRYYLDGSDSLPPLGDCQGRWWLGGWNPTHPGSWNEWGGVYPYHQGLAAFMTVNGTLKPMTPAQSAAGCDVKDAWGGRIFDKESYLYDLN